MTNNVTEAANCDVFELKKSKHIGEIQITIVCSTCSGPNKTTLESVYIFNNTHMLKLPYLR